MWTEEEHQRLNAITSRTIAVSALIVVSLVGLYWLINLYSSNLGGNRTYSVLFRGVQPTLVQLDGSYQAISDYGVDGFGGFTFDSYPGTRRMKVQYQNGEAFMITMFCGTRSSADVGDDEYWVLEVEKGNVSGYPPFKVARLAEANNSKR